MESDDEDDEEVGVAFEEDDTAGISVEVGLLGPGFVFSGLGLRFGINGGFWCGCKVGLGFGVGDGLGSGIGSEIKGEENEPEFG